MNRNQIKAIVFVVAFLIVVAVIVLLITGNSKKQEAAEPTAQIQDNVTADIAALPTPSGVYIVDAPPESYSYDSGSSSSGSSGSGAPSGTYVVEAPSDVYVVDEPGKIVVVDTPKPGGGGGGYSPAGVTIASGSFSSNTGTALNIDTSYSVVTATDSTVTVTVSANLRHAALNTGSRSVTFKADGQTASVSAGAINYSGGSTTTYLGSHTFTVNLSAGQSRTMNIGASWAFNGQYSGVSLTSIEGAGNVTISR